MKQNNGFLKIFEKAVRFLQKPEEFAPTLCGQRHYTVLLRV